MNNLGAIGEDLAQAYLKKQGFKILANNYHTRYGEIDIIAQKEELIVFVEVKTRKNAFFYSPLEAVNNAKINKLITSAQQYISLNHSEEFYYRFDIADIIYKDEKNYFINYLEGAFEL